MRSWIAIVIVAVAAACGGGKKLGEGPSKAPGTDEPAGVQPRAQAVALVCAAPTRTASDPDAADPANRPAVLAEHMLDGVTNPEVKEVVEGWGSTEKPQETKVEELKGLLARSGLNSKCELLDVWTSPSGE